MKHNNKDTILARRLRRVVAVAAVAGFFGTSASAAAFTFSQTGYADGATLTGSFMGEDLNSDGWLSHFALGLDQELSDFGLAFSGNARVEAFTFGLDDLQEFSFSLMGDSLLGNDLSLDPFAGGEGISVFDFNFGYFSGQLSALADGGMVQNFNSGGMDDAVMAIQVAGPDGGVGPPDDRPSAVPDSSNAAVLLLSGLAGLIAIRTSVGRIKKA